MGIIAFSHCDQEEHRVLCIQTSVFVIHEHLYCQQLSSQSDSLISTR